MLNDDHTGDTVCLTCALVLGPNYQAPPDERMEIDYPDLHDVRLGVREEVVYNPEYGITTRAAPPDDIRMESAQNDTLARTKEEFAAARLRKNKDGRESKAERKDKLRMLLSEEIQQVTSKLFMDNPSFTQTIIDLYEKVPNQRARLKHTINRQHLAYAFYQACMRQGTPKSAKVIAGLCSVKTSSILKVEKQVGCFYHQSEPYEYLDTMGHFLDLPYFSRQMAKMVLKRSEVALQGRKPETAAAAALFVVAKKVFAADASRARRVVVHEWSRKLTIPYKSLKSAVDSVVWFRVLTCGGPDNTFFSVSFTPESPV